MALDYFLKTADGKVLWVDPYIRPAKVGKVLDGDTLAFEFDFGFSQHLGSVAEDDLILLRLNGVDCPESSGTKASPAGVAAKEFTTKLCPVGLRVFVRTVKRKSKASGALLDAKEHYGRYLAQVLIPQPDGELLDLGAELLKVGHAKPYSGGKR